VAFERAQGAIQTLDALDANLTGRDREPIGLLRIHASVALARYVLAPISTDFLRHHPYVRLEFLAEDRRLDLVEAAVDIAFLLGEPEDSSHFTRKVGSFDRILAASPDFLQMNGRPETPADLSGLPCVAFTTAAGADTWRISKSGRTVEVTITTPVRANSGGIVHEAMLRGAGIGLVPAFLIAEDLLSGRLVRVLPAWHGGAVDVHAVWPSNRRLPGKARVFLEHAIEKIGQRPRTLEHCSPVTGPSNFCSERDRTSPKGT
jgi:DNA-binding transcriptional LysR family regulator